MISRLVLAAVVVLGLAAPGASLAQQEHEVKAAFLYRFLGFVEWPAAAFARPDSPVAIGVAGADDVLQALQEVLPGRVVQGRPLVARRVREGDSLAGLHVLYVGRANGGLTAKLGDAPGLLVVTDSPGALERGSVINFVRSDGRVRFEVAIDTAEQRGLRLSSRLLAVAQQVRGRQ